MKEKLKRIQNNKVLKILFMILKAIVSLSIVLIVSIIFVQRVSNNKVTLGGYSMFTIITESMVPKYEVGDMLLAKKVPFKDIKKGDDLVYIGNSGAFYGKIITHQVVDIEQDKSKFLYHTKGIANTIEDPVVSESQVYGVVVSKCFILSFLSKIINNIYGFYFIVFIPFAIMIFSEFINIIHDRDKKKIRKLENKDTNKNENKGTNKNVLKAILKVIKNKIKLRHFLVLSLLFTMNSFAWFIYINKISSDIDVKVKAWNISFEFNNEAMTDYVNFSVDEIYPGMTDYQQTLSVTNGGEVPAKLYYEIISVNILGTEYTTEDGSLTSDELVKKLDEEYPFKIKISTNQEVIDGNGGSASFKITVTWPYESYDSNGILNDELDTYWGNQAYQFNQQHPDTSCIFVKVKLSATQINP